MALWEERGCDDMAALQDRSDDTLVPFQDVEIEKSLHSVQALDLTGAPGRI